MKIFLKIFIFTSMLITFAIAVSFGIFYYVMPDFYLNSKNKILKSNAAALQLQLNQSTTDEQCIKSISDFIIENNAQVFAFNSQGAMIPTFSSPFVLMDDLKDFVFGVAEAELTEQELPENHSKAVVILNRDEEKKHTQLNMRIKIGDAVEGDSKDTFYYTSSMKNISTDKNITNGIIERITINSTLQPIDEAKSVIISLIPYLLLIDIVIAVAAAYFFARRLTNPILKISNAARQMHQMTPDTRSNLCTNDELGELSHNLDSLYASLFSTIENLQQLEQSKTDFMRAASHELKTPITALRGIVEGMIDSVGVYKNKDKYLGECKNLIDKLALLVQQILNASCDDGSEIMVNVEDVNVFEILKQAIEQYQIIIQQKCLKLSFESFDFVCMTDRRLLYNTLSNLISNAVNYTEREININFSDRVLSIENQCANIDRQEITKLFEPFYTRSYSRDKSKSGTGLGLYIVKKNLNALNIPFEMDNTDKGIKFSIKFV